MDSLQNKHEAVVTLVKILRDRLGKQAFHLVDHWPDDPTAIGIASPQNHGVLAYVSVNESAEEPYFVSLEVPPDGEWVDQPYSPGDERNECGIDEAMAMVAAHLKRALSGDLGKKPN